MFTLPIGDLLASYDGDSQIFSFEAPIFDGFYEDLTFLEPLIFTLKLLGLDNEIHAILSHLHTRVLYEGKKYPIHISEFTRIFRLHRHEDDTDDIGTINAQNMTIDLSSMIREEIIMSIHADHL